MIRLRHIFLLIALCFLSGNALAQTVGPVVTEGLQTCENGLRRCGSLSENPTAYWLCMEDTCSNFATRETNATCPKGQQACTKQLGEYRACIDLICLNPRGRFVECAAGKRQCGRSVELYWGCVHRSCIGEVDSFVRQARKQSDQQKTKRKSAIDTARGYHKKVINGVEFRYDLEDKLIPPMLGVPNQFRYPKDSSIHPKDFVMTTLPIRELKGTPTATLACRHPSAELECKGRDMSSCVCSDKSRPYFKDKTAPVAIAEPYVGDIPDFNMNFHNQEGTFEAIEALQSQIKAGYAEIKRVQAEAQRRLEAEKKEAAKKE